MSGVICKGRDGISMRNFLLMGTSGCHLCDEAADIIIHTLDPQRHQVDEVDIAFDDGMMERYALIIPVLRDEHSGLELCWPFDQQQLQRFLAELGV